MASPTTRFWLQAVTLIMALGAFFAGVFFSVWGNELTSPPWLIIMSVPGGGRFWGTLFLISGGLFLFGLDWTRLWPRIVGCAATGLAYGAIGVILAIAPFIRKDALNGSVGAWLMLSFLTLCLAGFMWSERRQEILDERFAASVQRKDPQ